MSLCISDSRLMILNYTRKTADHCKSTSTVLSYNWPFLLSSGNILIEANPECTRYTTSAIGPVFVIHHLVKGGLLAGGSKIILVSSESGSIKLRHESEGGGNYAHHASKSALNMVGRLLSLDLKEKGIAVGIVHVRKSLRVIYHDPVLC